MAPILDVERVFNRTLAAADAAVPHYLHSGGDVPIGKQLLHLRQCFTDRHVSSYRGQPPLRISCSKSRASCSASASAAASSASRRSRQRGQISSSLHASLRQRTVMPH